MLRGPHLACSIPSSLRMGPEGGLCAGEHRPLPLPESLVTLVPRGSPGTACRGEDTAANVGVVGDARDPVAESLRGWVARVTRGGNPLKSKAPIC